MGSIDRTEPGRPVQIEDAWIGELDQGLGWNDKPRSYRLLNAVLHAMRESLPVDEMADLSIPNTPSTGVRGGIG